MSFDLVVVGAGPAGLCFARSLAGSGLRIALVERQPESALRKPADDGREIAITHRSRQLLGELGLWERLHADEISTLRDAKVINGNDHEGLMFRDTTDGGKQLGWLLPNHAIRRAAFAAVAQLGEVSCISGVNVVATRRDHTGVEVELDNGETLRAGLLVAADSRFSETRRHAGISASMHDFGKTMLVCRMRHELPHAQTAWEWFAFGQTLALLPLHDAHTSSVVVTLEPQQMKALLALDDARLGAQMRTRFQGRLGDMSVAGPRCAYPLVGVYSRRFCSDRLALIGDAAVGMHPVTAHGFNFGLLGQATLARQVRAALAGGIPIWDPRVLRRYARRHRRATLPLYLATQMLANLYTDDRRPARIARKLALVAGAHLKPFQRMIVERLTHADGIVSVT
ncbi:MAG TPA: 5-demethoxyubiquinol-8 5-hydroxylase UbiM [Rudaea sp.]|nr:5-demethoxyubiquinol-8 5-hydroxylase UbiM [Rudaea sp.]